ncbi:excinuclease Cho [Xanthomonas campestris]|uniref:excinuclease Cho n=1 Tax=Xanthomonas campestris TaxID=339 RepID=UPI001CBE3371|nr:excinuclease Cho [Xanthomonas campestris]MEB1360433.1 excinuclease Cho [Xanthomonas campestris pv. campestris]UAU33179.1 excinuclease Cho [Xanthomonas campestris pv. incanae]WDJ53162.1 excinuclease Cho [Xanthomonas campestris pv. campestris]
MVGRAERAKRSWGAPDYTYPEHLRAELDTLPATPGVYLFHGQSSTLPLYIGKSIHLRNRVMDHFRNAAEASLLRQTRSIQVIEMAGDIGAQLLESQLIKTLRPLYNQKLRRIPRQFSIRLYRGEVSIEHSGDIDPAAAPWLYGLYSSPRAAKETLRRLADQHHLCYGLLGLERLQAGRPCFRAMLKRCSGACHGAEPLDAHEERLRSVLQHLEQAAWPFPGAIALKEQGAQRTQFHVLRDWHYLGSATSLAGARRLQATPGAFDRDCYRILRKYLETQLHCVSLL